MTMLKPLPEFLSYGAQYIDDDDCDAVMAVLRSDRLTCGAQVEGFEAALAQKIDADYVVTCSNGTAGLHLAAMALDIKPGDKVIVPTVTFLATANAPHFCGAEIVFCDVDPQTGLMTPDTFLAALDMAGEGVKAVFPVHLSGHVCDMEGIASIARSRNIAIVEDACHALGSLYKGRPVGNCEYSDMTMFSFHPVKNIAMGEGGVITTNNPVYAEKLRLDRAHGMIRVDTENRPWFYEMPAPGLNYRLTDIQCALGLSQLKKLDMFKAKRQELRQAYADALQPYGDFVKIVPMAAESDPCWHLCVVQIDFDRLATDRGTVMRRLAALNIGTQVHYIPVHTQPYYRNLKQYDLPMAQAYYDRVLSLPLHMNMDTDAVRTIVENLACILNFQNRIKEAS